MDKDAEIKRRLAHEGVFIPVFARNCEVRRIDRDTASRFLSAFHTLGASSCRYRYGLFIARAGHCPLPVGTMVAVATFSGARRWQKGDMLVSSYEWVRYASLPDVRVAGGMGKMLKYFIKEVRPDDIMSYAHTQWTDGDVYRRLGFSYEGKKVFPGGTESLKFRLKLTDY